MTELPIHLHRELELQEGDLIKVSLSNSAKVYLMTPQNYQLFLEWEPFEAFGGDYEHSPVKFQAPYAGTWHLAVQQLNEALSLTIEVEVITKPTKNTPAKSPKQKTPAKVQKGSSLVEWDLSNPNHCVLVVNKARKFLTRAEMNAFIHQIVRGKNPLAQKKLVYAWLQKERSDILVEAEIESYLSPILAEMIRLIRERLSIPGKG
jgi:hypothetical protein